MEAEPQRERAFLTTPLLPDEKQQKKVEDANYGTASFFKTCFHGVNALSGIGIVSVPYALASGGWLSLALLVIISLSAYYSGLMIQRCMDKDPTIKTFSDLGDRAFGNKGRLMVSVAMNCELYLVVTGYLILEGDNLNNLLPNIKIDIAGISISGETFFVLLIALIILPTVLMDNLSLLSYVSASGVLASGIFLIGLVWNGSLDGTGFHQRGVLVNLSGIPSAVSLYAFCYSAHPVFPTLYNSMKHKHQFSNVLIVCFLLCSFGYAAIAILGYLMFGQEVDSQITLNLPTGKLSSKVTIYTTLVNPIAKYALMLTPIVNATKGVLPCHYKNTRLTHIAISTTLLVSTVVVALAIPFFGDLMSLVGALMSVSASILVPCICYVKISGAYRRFGYDLIFNVGIIIMGVAIAIVGTIVSVKDIVKHL